MVIPYIFNVTSDLLKSRRYEMFIAYKIFITLSNTFRGKTFITLAIEPVPFLITGDRM